MATEPRLRTRRPVGFLAALQQAHPLPRPWTDLSNDEIDSLTRKAYVRFHSRPFFLLKSALQVRSFDEFRRKFLAWLEMRFRQEAVSTKDEKFQAYCENKGKLDWYKKISKWSTPF